MFVLFADAAQRSRLMMSLLDCFRLTGHEMMSDASEMLAAALEQMDGIIAGNHSVPISGHGAARRLPTSGTI